LLRCVGDVDICLYGRSSWLKAESVFSSNDLIRPLFFVSTRLRKYIKTRWKGFLRPLSSIVSFKTKTHLTSVLSSVLSDLLISVVSYRVLTHRRQRRAHLDRQSFRASSSCISFQGYGTEVEPGISAARYCSSRTSILLGRRQITA
jgi:hypothetical protein